MRGFYKAITVGLLSTFLLITACMDSKSTVEMYYDAGGEYKPAQLARLVILSENELASLWQQHTQYRFMKHGKDPIIVKPCQNLREDILWRFKEVELCSVVKTEFESVREQLVHQTTMSNCAYAKDILREFSDPNNFNSKYPYEMCHDNYVKYRELTDKVLSIVSKHDSITPEHAKAITEAEELDIVGRQLNSRYVNDLKYILSNQQDEIGYLDSDIDGQLQIETLTERRYALSMYKHDLYIKRLEPGQTLYRITPNDVKFYAPNWLKDILNFDNDEVLDILNHAKAVW